MFASLGIPLVNIDCTEIFVVHCSCGAAISHCPSSARCLQRHFLVEGMGGVACYERLEATDGFSLQRDDEIEVLLQEFILNSFTCKL